MDISLQPGDLTSPPRFRIQGGWWSEPDGHTTRTENLVCNTERTVTGAVMQ